MRTIIAVRMHNRLEVFLHDDKLADTLSVLLLYQQNRTMGVWGSLLRLQHVSCRVLHVQEGLYSADGANTQVVP